MPKPRYSVDDEVVLKRDPFSRQERDRCCRIAVVLPEAQGTSQYRIKFDDENFERRIAETDIDHAASANPIPTEVAAESVPTGSWVNSIAIRIKR